MRSIDADAHVLETPATWAFLDGAEREHAPAIVRNEKGEFWRIDGKLHRKDTNIGADTGSDARELRDIAARLKHMDELEIDVQVLYPTVFLRPYTQRPEVELALCRSYNRWLGEIWKASGGRLRWVAMAPFLSLDKVPEELLRAKDNGACGVYMRGHESERRLTDPYFHAVYALAEQLDMPVCVHSASGSYTVSAFMGEDNFSKFKLAVVGACHALLFEGTPQLFPKLRWAFIEVSAQWIPYVLNDLVLRCRRRGRPLAERPLAANNIYVACQVTDDLAYILPYAGEDNLVIGTDYGHADTASEIDALRLLKTNGMLPARAVDKILSDNARRLYGI
jgi:predicted TIM-barrel fold metal-dependent hydrolase